MKPSKTPRPTLPGEEDKVDEGDFTPGVGGGGIGAVKLGDFGLSKIIAGVPTATPCGTMSYAAPEIVRDEKYTTGVDMWAIGCVLYTLLAGYPPFYDPDTKILMKKVAKGQYTFLSPWWDDISKSAQDLISHLLTVDPEKRFTITEFLAHPWIAGNGPTPASEKKPGITSDGMLRAFDANRLQDGDRRYDFRSPGAVNLREVFDVSYSVHRQEEEGKRRKNFTQGYRGAAAMNSLNPLDEYDDEQDEGVSAPYDTRSANPPAKLPKAGAPDVGGVEKQMRNTSLSAAAQARQANAPRQQPAQQKGYGQHSPEVAAAARKQVRNKGPFELSLDNATLLGRRGKKGPSNLREQVVQ